MAKKQTPQALLSKHLGKKSADALMKKINTMAKKGSSAAQIGKAIDREIAAQVTDKIMKALVVEIGVKPIKVSSVRVSSIVKPIGVTIKPIKVDVPSIKIGPGTYVKGTR